MDPKGTTTGVDAHLNTETMGQRERRVSDPFALHRDPNNNPFQNRRGSDGSTSSTDFQDGIVPLAQRDRRMSKEWDASKTPPSRFQKVEGSIYATPASRDGHVARNKIHGFKEKVKELGGVKK
ncbi:hypothetical protein EDC01DRAFT_649851 [Geopyxis carbonaria]|nr:hypothetical protein EDC01DRAFT_649851 [Geopyxis carbonaria]